jgi:chemotaxis protein MotB
LTFESMSEDKNPFTEPEPVSKPRTDASKAGWVAAGFMVLLLIVVSLLWAAALGKVHKLDPLQASLDVAKASLTNALAEAGQTKEQVSALKAQVADLEKEKEMAGQMAKALENEMRSDLESKDVTISNLQGKLTVNILDRVMFNSGEAILQPDGETVLRTIAGFLVGHPGLKIHVIGHTDNVPIRGRFVSNWELSTARALAAVHFLTEKAGVAPNRVGAVGYGEFRPIADNATPEGRARNRRIAITILPDELAGDDTVPTAETNAPVTGLPAPAVK